MRVSMLRQMEKLPHLYEAAGDEHSFVRGIYCGADPTLKNQEGPCLFNSVSIMCSGIFEKNLSAF